MKVVPLAGQSTDPQDALAHPETRKSSGPKLVQLKTPLQNQLPQAITNQCGIHKNAAPYFTFHTQGMSCLCSLTEANEGLFSLSIPGTALNLRSLPFRFIYRRTITPSSLMQNASVSTHARSSRERPLLLQVTLSSARRPAQYPTVTRSSQRFRRCGFAEPNPWSNS